MSGAEKIQPDLRTQEGARDFLKYHAPNEETVEKHAAVNDCFQNLLDDVWQEIPDGPGKTRFIHALNRARMEANSCIANNGA